MVVAGRLCEANLFRLPHAAWLAGERVLSDGGLVLVTPVDPLFLALPLLEAARRQARPVRITLSGFPCIMGHPLLSRRWIRRQTPVPCAAAARSRAQTGAARLEHNSLAFPASCSPLCYFWCWSRRSIPLSWRCRCWKLRAGRLIRT